MGKVFDVAILGGGHNGLVCAAYLAKAGLSICVVEKNAQVGGAALTEEFHPGFRNSVASYTVSLLNPQVIADLQLHAHGLQIVERPVANFWPTTTGQGLVLPYGLQQRQQAIAEFSPRDAERLPAYDQMLERAAAVLRELILETPPNSGDGWSALWKAIMLGHRWSTLSQSDQQLLVDLFTRSAASVLEQWFEHDLVRAAFAFDGVVGTFASPQTPGTAYVLLHHCFGEVNGKSGVWGHAVGGMGAITQAMARAATAAGVEIRANAAVARVEVHNAQVSGLTLMTGETINARKIAVNIPPKLLCRDYLPPNAMDESQRQRFLAIDSGSGTFRMNVALSELPQFSCRPATTQQPHHGAGIVIGAGMGYLENAYHSAAMDGWSREPIVELLIPSVLDSTLAPAGQHVASLFVQHVKPQLPARRSWQDATEKAAFAEVVIDTVTRYAPNFRSAIVGTQVLSPLDLEQRFGLIDGDIFHGQLRLGQLFSARPVLGSAAYRLPVQGLYLCGSGAHPGGGVTGLPGRNAAREILRDCGKAS
ncbi:MAG: NAD(P)/FAD-dependent oxidoreductase [Pseudomonadota bacterium]